MDRSRRQYLPNIIKFVAVALLFCVVVPNDSNAFVRSRSIAGAPIFWSNPVIPLAVNPTNSSGLNEAEIDRAFRSSFGEWTRSGTSAGFSYNQSPNVAPVSGNDGSNTIYFASAGGRRLGSGVVAVTEVTYFVDSGQIVGMDMVFNDKEFLFTMNEGDTGDNDLGDTKIYLPDVATHEAGHAFGFDHSNVHRSSLTYVAFNGQFQTGNDDIRGMHAVFDVGAPNRNGSASGQVVGLNGGIFGAHVNAINLQTGKIEGATLSEPDGRFTISKLPPGDYSIFVEPFLTSPTTISPFYANVNHRFCSGAYFQRTFYSACGAEGRAASIDIRNRAVELGAIAPSCARMANSASDTSDNVEYQVPDAGGAFFNPLAVDQTHYYRLENVSGEIKAKAMSYTLFSPIDVEVEILFPDGSPIPTSTTQDNVEEPMPGGLTNFNASAEAWNLAVGDYLVRISSKPDYLWSFLFPAGLRLMDGAGFYLLSIAVDEEIPATGIQDMNACRSVANTFQPGFTFGGGSLNAADNDNDLSSGCASISTGPPGGGPGNPFESPIVLALLVALLTKILSLLRPTVAGSIRRR